MGGARMVLLNYCTQENGRSRQNQRSRIARASPAAGKNATERSRSGSIRHARRPGAALRQAGLSMQGRRAARAVYVRGPAQTPGKRTPDLCRGRAGRSCAPSNRGYHAGRGDVARDFRDQSGVVKPPEAGLSDGRGSGGVAGASDGGSQYGRSRARRGGGS